jgi:molybdate transport system permease protein
VTAALVHGFARALGEFGATLLFAGIFKGRTNTMPIEIFTANQAGDDERATLFVALLSVLSIVVVALASRLQPGRAER